MSLTMITVSEIREEIINVTIKRKGFARLNLSFLLIKKLINYISIAADSP